MADDDDDRHDRRRRELGARADADRKSIGKKAFTDAERDRYVDGLLEREGEAREARWRAQARRSRIVEALTGNIISGVVGGLILSFCIWLGQWIVSHLHP